MAMKESSYSTKVGEIISSYTDITNGLGKLKGVQIKLDIDETVKPVSQHQRKIPFHLRKKVGEKVDELLELGVIEHVPENEATPWVSPLLAVPKNNDTRLNT